MNGGLRAPDPAGFDRFRDSYEDELNRVVAFTGQDADVFAEAKARVLLELAHRKLGDTRHLDVLDVGCGIGSTDRYLSDHVRTLFGVDVSEGMILRASAANPSASYAVYDSVRLPFDDQSFDLVFAVCVVHHVPPTDWVPFVAEMARVTRRAGVVAIAEHNPLNPVTRRIVANCAFDDTAVLLSGRTARALLRRSGLEAVEITNTLFVPWRNGFTEGLERLVKRVPLGAQYVATGRRVT
jgi:SAM-dependent methyltransferase